MDFLRKWFSCGTRLSRNFIIYVKTGDQKNAGTDAGISITLVDFKGNSSGPHDLDKSFRDDFEQGQTDDFPLDDLAPLGDLAEIELRFDASGLGAHWYCELVTVKDLRQKKEYYFPVHRWFRQEIAVKLTPYDSQLPQYSKHQQQRERELVEKRKTYKYTELYPGLPIQAEGLPEEDMFSDSHKWDMMKRKYTMIAATTWEKIFTWTDEFKSFDEVFEMFDKFSMLEKPKGVEHWREDDHFGQQRLNGCNPKLITLCQKIPEKFKIETERLEKLLESRSIEEALKDHRLFIVDLEILEGIHTAENTVLCAPLALFYVNNTNKFLPIAIQLNQSEGPVFYPDDDEYVWLLAKMWYNNADASYHQSCVHLAGTHLLMEGISVCANRELSPSHPIYRFLAPHFLYLLAINSLGLQKLISPGGWVETTMTIAREGMLQLMAKRHGQYELERDGDFKEDLKKRGLLEDVIPNYYYRKDGLRLYEIISDYVTKSVHLFYNTEKDLQEDYELQNFVKGLTDTREGLKGLGLKGVPGGAKIVNHDELIRLLRLILFICSGEHAAANFSQYDNYAFPPNYPPLMMGRPPLDKTPKSETDLLSTLSTKPHMMDTMVITKILSTRSTQKLGDFETQYHYKPEILSLVREFRTKLDRLSGEIKKELPSRVSDYSILDPETVPNSISI